MPDDKLSPDCELWLTIIYLNERWRTNINTFGNEKKYLWIKDTEWSFNHYEWALESCFKKCETLIIDIIFNEGTCINQLE